MLISMNVSAKAEFRQEEVLSVEHFIELAKTSKLAQQTAWLNLLHYKRGISGSWKSQADDRRFFMSAQGDNDTEAELVADLRAFFSEVESEKADKTLASHSQCRFPARLHWLNSKLDFKKHLPEVNCSDYEQWKKKIDAKKVTLLFPSMHLDNPASMFGHTFLRFDGAGKNALLSKTLSYAAATDKSDSPLVYAWKGIMGGYNGQFYIKAYFETVQEYSDIEQRDIWEYSLNLNEQEVAQLVRHLWEVRGIKFDYYFLRENCAFRLLALLDVARENLNLSLHSHPVYAIPVDTVRDIEKAGLIDQRLYRPATHNKITQMAEQLPEKNSSAAIALSSGELSIANLAREFNQKEQAEILLLADEVLSQKKQLSKEDQELQLAILSSRSKLSIRSEELEFNFLAAAPEGSHLSARWQFSVGETDHQRFYEIGFRPVFHDLLDRAEGFVEGAGISILDAQLRWYEKTKKLKLQQLDLFSIRSIVAVKPWISPVSRQVSVKVKRRDINVTEQITEFSAQFDIGYATNVSETIVYLMAKSEIDYATELEDNHAFYLGAESGLLWNLDNNVLSGQAELKYQNLQQISGEQGDVLRVIAGVQLNILKNQALRFEYNYTDYESFDVQEGKLSYLVYF